MSLTRSSNNAQVTRRFLVIEGWILWDLMPARSMTVNLFPCLGVVVCQLIGSNSDNISVFLMELEDIKRNRPTDQTPEVP